MYAGIDIGGTTVGVAILGESDEVLFYEKIGTDRSYDHEIIESQICKMLERALSSLSGDNLESIGIGVPGIVSKNRDRVISCTNLGWKNIAFGRILAEKFDSNVSLYNDASSAGYGEFRLGAMKHSPNSVLMTLGTGLGGGIIRDGRIYEGANGAASELGHMTIGDNFYTCGCGRVGCLETFASGTALAKYANKLLMEQNQSFRVGSAREVFDLCTQGDEVGVQAVERFTRYLAIGIVNIIATIDPEKIVLGGGLSLSGDIYLEKLKEYVIGWRYFKEIPPPAIELSKLGEKAGVLGAALLGREAISS